MTRAEQLVRTDALYILPEHADLYDNICLTVMWPLDPDLKMIEDFVKPLLDVTGKRGEGAGLQREPMEHITIYGGPANMNELREGDDGLRDMFVSEVGSLEMRYRPPFEPNPIATLFYHRAHKLRNPKADLMRLPRIYGPAVVFPDRKVWF
jgi:hypothetical protein